MSMSFWVILSWIFVFILTAINVGVFLKLKQASEQMMGAMFPGQNMKDVMSNMQGMMAGMQQGKGGARGGNPFAAMQQSLGGGRPAPGGKQNKDAQLKAAMDMLNKMQKR